MRNKQVVRLDLSAAPLGGNIVSFVDDVGEEEFEGFGCILEIRTPLGFIETWGTHR